MVNSNYYIKSELAIAEAHLHTAIQLVLDYAQAYVTLADMLTKAKQYGEAPVALFNAAQMNADEISLHLKWGQLRKKKRQGPVALEHYQIAMNLAQTGSSEYQAALSATASLYSAQGKYPEAVAVHQELIELRSDDAWTWGSCCVFIL